MGSPLGVCSEDKPSVRLEASVHFKRWALAIEVARQAQEVIEDR